MGNLVRQEQFLLKAVDDGLVPRQFGPNDLQGYHAVELDILRFVNRPHASFPENLDDLVAPG